ncbi:MAG: PAS domain-containing hybrid sensor histidine kinase/response regulator [Hyphomicrobiales bacterium]
MLPGWVIIASALAYIGFLFAVASFGDRLAARRRKIGRGRPLIYALSLGVYCTSWTFFGSVGFAAKSGLDFLTIYVGPLILFGLGYPILRRIVRLAKAEKITSIADFLGSRYGKNEWVAAVATIIAVVGTVPYIALQLKAVSSSLATSLGQTPAAGSSPIGDIALVVALSMAAFAVLFGTRHIDATEHQEGLMLAIAAESVVKLVAFLAVGFYVVYGIFDGPQQLFAIADEAGITADLLGRDLSGGTWITMTLLSLFAGLLLPRQFHVTVVENNAPNELRRAAWLFPVYLVAINLFVIPVSVAGLVHFGGAVDADTFVLRLPMAAGNGLVSLAAFIGGLSAATAMVIVATVALAIMISNDLVMPLVLRRGTRERDDASDMGTLLLNIRRLSIFVILLLAYAYYRLAGNTAALASIGLLSFAAIAQFAPAFVGGLIWRRATARGAIAGMSVGFAVWAYTLLLPNFAASGIVPESIIHDGPFGIGLLKPQALLSFAFDPLTHGVFWSLTFNVLAFVVVSLARMPEPIERLQANLFVPAEFTQAPALRLFRTTTTVGDLRSTVARYLGEERTERSFNSFAEARSLSLEPHREVDAHLLRYSEQLLASAIGAASSRLVLSLLLKRSDASTKGALKLLDDASAAIQYNRDLLQTALDQVRQGICVFDRDLRLICWNRHFRDMLGLPTEFGQVGISLHTILRFNAERGELGPGDPDAIVADRIDRFVVSMQTFQERMHSTGVVLEVRPNAMPGGGIVATYTDITDRVAAADALERAKETLEVRVRDRTEELTRLNQELARAKSIADEANIGKTRFLAAAGHDILQPLNAARLYVTSLVERHSGDEDRRLIQNVDASLEAVEEIIGAVLDISRLDAGALKPEIGTFRLDEILNQLAVEYAPLAKEKKLDLVIVPSGLTVRSDRRLLRRLLQNLVSNAIKYTASGRVLVGCRRRRGKVRVDVFDTGLGIPLAKQKVIFKEFQRLEAGARAARGLGLGLSIVERISRVLDHPVTLTSTPGRGSKFSVEIPLAESQISARTEPTAMPTPATQLAGMTVLCIDNEARILDGMEALLSGWGCTVLKAGSTREALKQLRDRGGSPDVVLVDYHLDEGTGLETVSSLRSRFGAGLPAVLITADRSPSVRDAARDRNIGVLNKPLKPAALRAVLAQWRVQRPAAE